MAERITAIFADQIADLALGDGVQKNAGDDTKLELALKANDGLKFDTGEVTVDYDDSTVGIISNVLAVKDGGITEAKLDVFNAPVDKYFLQYTTANGLEWTDIDADGVQNDDYIANEIPSGLINSANTTYTLANTPITDSVMIFLNGLLQAPGSGGDR